MRWMDWLANFRPLRLDFTKGLCLDESSNFYDSMCPTIRWYVSSSLQNVKYFGVVVVGRWGNDLYMALSLHLFWGTCYVAAFSSCIVSYDTKSIN